jgi:4'-phosphopantetheinyl transferase
MSIPSSAVEVWLARPAQVRQARWDALTALLDRLELAQAQRFKMPADQHSYVLAHALRRRVLADILGAAPSELAIGAKPGGQPVLLEPAAGDLHFSHSRSRELVAFAITSTAPVGIDVEAIREEAAGFDWLARYVVLPEVPAVSSPDRAREFFFYWTALEAFWKAQGTGLKSGHPRMRCRAGAGGSFELSLEAAADRRRAWLSVIEAVPGHAIALALQHSSDADGAMANPAVTLRDGNQLV